jgi:hypothetical protein
MIFKIYKSAVSLLWFLASLLYIAIAYSLSPSENINLSFSGAHIYFIGGCIFVAAVSALVGIGTYFRKKVVLIFVVPLSLFCVYYFVDHVSSEIVLEKYIYMSLVILVINICTIHVVLKDMLFAKSNA